MSFVVIDNASLRLKPTRAGCRGCLFLPRIFLGTASANSCARQLSGFCFPGSSRQILLKRTEVLLCSWLRFQLFPLATYSLLSCFCRFEIAASRRVNPHATGLH